MHFQNYRAFFGFCWNDRGVFHLAPLNCIPKMFRLFLCFQNENIVWRLEEREQS